MNVRQLWGLSIGYLLIPNLLFFYYWTTPLIAVAGIPLLLFLFLSQLTEKTLLTNKILCSRSLISIGLFAFILTLLSGTTGICWQDLDHWCHTTKFHDLFIYEWPFRYPESGPVISYYYGYYLVPALFFKMTGSIHEGIIFFWTFLGLYLGTAWIFHLLNKKMGFVLLCLCLGDTPLAIRVLAERFGIILYPNDNIEMELWSFTSSLLPAPNQVIPTLIIAGMLVYLLKNRMELDHIIFPIALSLWWAVFPALTIGFLTGVLILKNWTWDGFRPDLALSARRIVLTVLVCLPVLFLYASHQTLPISGFVWTFDDSKFYLLVEYLINIAFNIMLFLLFHRIVRHSGAALPEFPFYLTLVLMLVFPVYRIGVYNDFIFRGLLPYTIIIGLYLLIPFTAGTPSLTLAGVAKKSVLHFMLLSLLLFSTFISIRRIKRAVQLNVLTARLFPNTINFDPYPYDAYPTIYEMLKDKYSLLEARQYLGKENSVYEKYLAKKPNSSH